MGRFAGPLALLVVRWRRGRQPSGLVRRKSHLAWRWSIFSSEFNGPFFHLKGPLVSISIVAEFLIRQIEGHRNCSRRWTGWFEGLQHLLRP